MTVLAPDLTKDDVRRELQLTDYRALVLRACHLVGAEPKESISDLLYLLDMAKRSYTP